MTVLTRTDRLGDPALVVICDRCGQAVRTSELAMSDFLILWQILQQTGWTGPHRPVGPHFCPTCVDQGQLDSERSTRGEPGEPSTLGTCHGPVT